MRDPERIDRILQEIGDIWRKYPDMRLGQLIGNVLEGTALYYVEDDGLVSALRDEYESAKETVRFDWESFVFGMVNKHPGEFGFILQSKTFEDYVATYTDAGGKAEDAAYNAAEFKALKDFFASEE